ncbi:MAG: CvpA family protein [Calditrichaeota bacterium]|nr:CvpA family protein [Calditrichota bacterium]
MTVYDLIIVFVILGFAIAGYFKGFICEVFEIAGVIIGIFAGRSFSPALANLLPAKAPLFIRLPICAVFIAVVAFFMVKIIGWLIQKILVHGPLKILNRLGGIAMGFIQGGLVIAFILMLVAMTPFYAKLENARPGAPVLDYSIIISKPIIKRYQSILSKSAAAQAKIPPFNSTTVVR